jgi:hypothetical protein
MRSTSSALAARGVAGRPWVADWVRLGLALRAVDIREWTGDRIAYAWADRLRVAGSLTRGRIACAWADRLRVAGSRARGRIACAWPDRLRVAGSPASVIEVRAVSSASRRLGSVGAGSKAAVGDILRVRLPSGVPTVGGVGSPKMGDRAPCALAIMLPLVRSSMGCAT